jgi:hypothetical protein
VITVGIDPGITGAVAFVDSRGSCVVEDIPTVELPGNGMVKRRIDGRALALLLRRHVPAADGVLVVLEAVGVMPSKGNSPQSQGSLMRSLGAIEAVLEVLRLPVQTVRPQAWKAHYGLKRAKDEKDSAYKARSLGVARGLYPNAAAAALARAKDHNRAEAVLLAHYGQKELS